MGPNFKEKFDEICTCESHEQCMGPTEKTKNVHFFPFHRNTNPALVLETIAFLLNKKNNHYLSHQFSIYDVTSNP